MIRRPDLRDRTATGILDAAAQVFSERGEAASMAEVASAAGVGRATLYRYFPSRQALLNGLVELAFAELQARVADAELDTVDVREGLSRLCRGFMTAGTRFAFMARMGGEPADKDPETEHEIARPIRELLRRGVADGTLRGDIPTEILFSLFTGLIQNSLRLMAGGELGPEQASAAVIAVFFDGAAAA
ncbi:TetR/AcrR family transcriptional regulator [Glycomyces tenuis]|uniref:TetR/AcrR family transcriptional regulator n=1 Tax=Glycomyces tenuis TaxID=58116 RepID=UPI0003F4FC65|nr:TetR/AcrR family transcriptional regulator [Glycomyces tenuis]